MVKEGTAVKIKICGIRRSEDIDIINRQLPDYAGFVFVPSGRRVVTPEYAADLIKQLVPEVLRVGVFVDAKPGSIAAAALLCRLDVVQLHGNEDCLYAEMLRESLCASGLHPEIWKVVRIRKRENLKPHTASCKQSNHPILIPHFADAVVLDTFEPEAQGGTGKVFDWEIAEKAKKDEKSGWPDRSGLKVVLAGGLTPQNVGEAIRRIRPFAVDVSSGVETGGSKDEEKINRFIRAVKDVSGKYPQQSR